MHVLNTKFLFWKCYVFLPIKKCYIVSPKWFGFWSLHFLPTCYSCLRVICLIVTLNFYICRIHMAPFSDEYLFVEIASKVRNYMWRFTLTYLLLHVLLWYISVHYTDMHICNLSEEWYLNFERMNMYVNCDKYVCWNC